MNLEEIITAAVEKRVREMVSEFLNDRSGHAGIDEGPTPAEHSVAREIAKMAVDETSKHSEEIRAKIREIITKGPISFKIDTYASAQYPKDKYQGEEIESL